MENTHTTILMIVGSNVIKATVFPLMVYSYWSIELLGQIGEMC